LIGNDLVDLRARESEGKSRDTRFVARVFTAREAELIAGSSSPDFALWMLWAAKEAAYKVAKKLRADAIFAHSRYEVTIDPPGASVGPGGESTQLSGHVLVHDIPGLERRHFPLEWTSSASFIHCVAMDLYGDFHSLKIAIAGHDELAGMGSDYHPTAREQASIPRARSAESLAVRRLARALASEAGLGEVEILRERVGDELGPPRLYALGGAQPLAGWDVTLSHDGSLAAAALCPSPSVIPAKAGIHVRSSNMDSRLRGNDRDRLHGDDG
jgi:4'-phosphopantetheinyl transferase EntD